MPSMPALAEGDHAHDLPGIAEARSGRDQDAQPLAFGQARDLDPGRQGGGDGGDLLRGGAIAAQGRLEGFALAEDDVPLLDEGSWRSSARSSARSVTFSGTTRTSIVLKGASTTRA